MSILGAHMSIAGGHHKAVERAAAVGCQCVQIFTKNCNQWRARDITDRETARFRAALQRRQISHPIAHGSYLINLASPDPALWKRSVDALAVEARRAAKLGIPHVVVHPGAYTTGSEVEGLKQIIRGLDRVHRQTDADAAECLLETTAGQGTAIGWRFEHLAAILEGVKEPQRLGVCLDTCHVFAAGYALSTQRQYQATMREFDKIVGLRRVRVVHLNDSKRPLGSRIDRHEHIGRGEIGLEAFRLLLGDRRFRTTPMCLETPKGIEKGENLDAVNLRTLRSLSLS